MSARRTIPRLETLAYAVRSLWSSHVICGGFHVIYDGLVTGDIEVGQSHDRLVIFLWINNSSIYTNCYSSSTQATAEDSYAERSTDSIATTNCGNGRDTCYEQPA